MLLHEESAERRGKGGLVEDLPTEEPNTATGLPAQGSSWGIGGGHMAHLAAVPGREPGAWADFDIFNCFQREAVGVGLEVGSLVYPNCPGKVGR